MFLEVLATHLVISPKLTACNASKNKSAVNVSTNLSETFKLFFQEYLGYMKTNLKYGPKIRSMIFYKGWYLSIYSTVMTIHWKLKRINNYHDEVFKQRRLSKAVV